ncbi:MAG: tetratricopeptide repeat protein [Bacteroidales bacterium]
MDKTALTKYIKNPAILNEKTVAEINRLKDDYPFFQTAYLLSLKNVHNIGSAEFEKLLHLTAAYVTDRRILYDLLYNAKPVAERSGKSVSGRIIKENLKENISETVASQLYHYENCKHDELEFIPEVAIDIRKEYGEGIELDEHIFSLNILETDTLESTTGNKAEEKLAGSTPVPLSQKVSPESEILEIDDSSAISAVTGDTEKPATDGRSEMAQSITDEEEIEFDLTEDTGNDVQSDMLKPGEKSVKEINTTATGEEDPAFAELPILPEDENNDIPTVSSETGGQKEKKVTNFDLIDKFILSEPKRIIPTKVDDYIVDISEHSAVEHEGFITDTLAKIYIKQGYYTKAIFAYEKLILKFPEKSSYFAAQIEEIKNIIKNL